MKIAVMAGTPIDTQMGVILLEKRGFSAIPCPISRTSKEQDAIQFLSQKELFSIVLKKIEEAKNKGAAALFIYCNSLSSALNIPLLKEKTKIPIISPLDSYQKIGLKHSDILLLAANSIATKKVEAVLKSANPEISVLSIGYLNLVHNIENLQDKEQILKESALPKLFNFFNSLPENKNRIVLLACTHFPYLKKEMQELSNYPIIDPVDIMLSYLENL